MNQVEIERWLVERIAEKARIEPESIEVDQPIFAYGIDSAFAASLSGELAERTHRVLNPTLFFEFPSIEQVVAHLAMLEAGTAPAQPGASAIRTGLPIDEDIAIVGIGCRMPGAPNKEAFWRALAGGQDGISAVPKERWDVEVLNREGVLGTTRIPAEGGFIDGLEEFDAAFFRIAPSEARHMDPQQRILLQMAWEALEDAGCVPSHVRGSRGGVFVGISHSDYSHRQFSDLAEISAFSGIGSALSIAANRLSYFFDLKGPSLAVDTACSSALTATHLALKCLRTGECDFALVGGINLLISSEVTVGLAHAGMLSTDARCRSFDAGASGYVRGEGGGVVMLKPLSASLKSGDRVYAVIKGSAINQDGKSNGLTAPNPASQEQVLREAYARSGIDPATVRFIEAHGTGTPLGDPIEAFALSRVLCNGREPENPLLIGSVKSNIGHLEAAAGLAGLIKAALSLYHKTMPASLHFQQGNPKIDFAALRLKVLDQPVSWSKDSRAAVCGVSSFGFGGTNAHVVLQEGPHHVPVEPERGDESGTQLVCLSAAAPVSLRQIAEGWASWLGNRDGVHEHVSLKQIAYTSLARREHLPYRKAFVVKSKEQLIEQLLAAASDEPVSMGKTLIKGRRALFVFPGQGRHWAKLGPELLDQDPLFRSVIRRCDEEARAHSLLDWSIEKVLRDGLQEVFADAVRVQPVIFAIQLGLTALLKSHGIEPSAVIGHSVGEIAAACACGALHPTEGLRLAIKRGQAMSLQSEDGATLAIAASAAEAKALAEEFRGISVAADNGPDGVTLAGNRAVLERLYKERLEKGLASFWVNQSFAFHSHLMERAAAALEDDLHWLVPRSEQLSFYSTVTGRRAAGTELDAGYWARNVRDTVLFADALNFALSTSEKFDAVIEISTQAVLQSAIRQSLESRGAQKPVLLSTLTHGANAVDSFLQGVAQLYEAGFSVRYRLTRGTRPGLVSLPPYAWSKDRHWIESRPLQHARRMLSGRSLLGTGMCNVPEAGIRMWAGTLDAETHPSLLDHRVGNTALVPAAAQISMMINALSQAGVAPLLMNGRFTAPMYLREEPVKLNTIITFSERKPVSISISSESTPTGKGGIVNSVASVASGAESEIVQEHMNIGTVKARCNRPVDANELYTLLASVGLNYGTSFRLAHDIAVGSGEALARLHIPKDDEFEKESFDPRLLDAAFHPLMAAARTVAGMDGPGIGVVPVGFDRFQLAGSLSAAAYTYIRIDQRPEGRLGGSVRLLAENGLVLAAVDGLTFSEPRRAALPEMSAPAAEVNKRLFSYESVWREWHGDATTTSLSGKRCLVFVETGPVGDALLGKLARQGAECFSVLSSNRFHRDGRTFEIAPGNPQHYKRVLDAVCSETNGNLDLIANLWLLPSENAGKDEISHVRFEQQAAICLETIKAVTFAPAAAVPLLLFATRGVHSVPGGPGAFDPAGALAGGMAKALPFENPTMNCRCVDLNSGSPDELAEELMSEAQMRDGETAVLRWQGQRYVRRVVQTLLRPPTKKSLRGDGTYIVTGGTGGIGPRILEWLAQRGARRIVHVGRRARNAQVLEMEDRLREQGVDVEYIRADITDANAVEDFFGHVGTRFNPIRGVIHAAGVLADEPLLSMSDDHLAAVIPPKANGLVNLMRHVPHQDLDLVVLFSSAASILGSPGQANYSSANAFLDAYADMLRAKGVRAISAGWGPWAETGMAAERESSIRDLADGLNFIRPSDGIDALDALIEHDYQHVMVLPFDLQNLVQHYPQGPGFSLFDELFDRSTVVLRSAGKTSKLASRPSLSVEYVAPRNDLERMIAGTWQRALGISQIGVHDSFFELGGDSVFGNQILVEISRQLGVTVDPESVFEQFTIATLAAHIEEKMLEDIEEMSEEEAAEKLAVADAEGT
ncbi:type I polyketide synthase [Noviherbaspirillum sp.]|jgi:acyl transferase domain-containing protein/acyl carrier protein|uniref:type I polyketide synthase n=1 Tax=Noviherbaspirillum sp. TaxID=1926288 RepID=UPI0025EC2BB6|nr:type I polyketide synthase [Noviherbaspirillum sp.]